MPYHALLPSVRPVPPRVRLALILGASLTCGAPAAQAKHREPPTAPVAPAAGAAASPAPEPVPPSEPPPAPLLPGSPPPGPVLTPFVFPPPPPSQPSRRPWNIAIIGAGIVGGASFLSLAVGAMSYGFFYEGQAGWFAPIVGPFLAMGGVGGPTGPCFSRQFYSFGFGGFLGLLTIGGLVTTATGIGIALASPRTPAAGPQARLKLAPYGGFDGGGLVFHADF